MESPHLYNFTGHPFVDVGAAALAAICERPDPAQLTPEDCLQAAQLMEGYYTRKGTMQSLVRGMVLLNAGYWMEKQRDEFVARVLYSWRSTVTLDEKCAFCERRAAYRANRETIPLLNGRDTYNFSPRGQAGIPVCGWCSLAIQALPLGCAKSGGVLIAAHSDDPALVAYWARENVRANLRALTLDEEYPTVKRQHTHVIETLMRWLRRLDEQEDRPITLSAYCFTNAGQNPAIQILRLPPSIFRFLRALAVHPDSTVQTAWDQAIYRAYRLEKGQETPDPTVSDNRLYRALLAHPFDATYVLREFLLPTMHWGLVALYLRKGMGMTEEKIALLRRLGERFGDYALEHKAFFYEFTRENGYAKWRRAVLRAADDCIRATGSPLITFDEFIEVFTAPQGEINDWRLARDLIALIMIEKRGPQGEALFTEDETLEEGEEA